MNRNRIRTLIVLAALAAGALPAAAAAHYQRVNWSYKGGSCARVTDPTTLVYEGRGATARRAIIDVEKHTGWRNDDPDTFLGAEYRHSFYGGHGCLHMDGERANRSGVGNDRTHVRLFQLPHRAENGWYYTFMTPHKEDWVGGLHGCTPIGSHAVEPGHVDPDHQNRYYKSSYYSGFDHGRDTLLNRIVARRGGKPTRHRVEHRVFRNTSAMRQCNGWWSGSSGNVFTISLGKTD